MMLSRCLQSAKRVARLFSSIKVFWGSETGTAEEFSETLVRLGREDGLEMESIDMGQADPEDLASEDTAIFIVACFGVGEPTTNAELWYDYFCDSSPDASELDGLKFSVFGLGDSMLFPDFYNIVGKDFDESLEKFGGERLLPLGLGDASGDIDGDFEDWSVSILEVLSEL